MTLKQKNFAEYYAQCGNAVQSAISAGYSESYARKLSHKLLKNIEVAEYLNELSAKTQNERILTAIERQEMLSEIAKDIKGVPPAYRIRAIDTLNKMTGEYTTQIQAEVKTSEKFSDIISQLGGEELEE